MKNSSGFTLLETVISIMVVGILITAMVGVMLNSSKASSKSKAAEKLEEEGAFILKELRRNLSLADASTILCPSEAGVPYYIYFKSNGDGRDTTIRCSNVDRKIASISAAAGQTININSSGTLVSGCETFVKKCDLSGEFPVIELQFNLHVGQNGDVVNVAKRTFNQTIVIRK